MSDLRDRTTREPPARARGPDGSGGAGGTRPGTDRLLLAAAAGVLLWLAADVLLLVFASALLAVGLDGLATGLARRTPLPRGLALAVVALLLAGLLAALGTAVLPRIAGQMDDLREMLAAFVEAASERLDDWGLDDWGWPGPPAGEGEGSGQQVAEMAGSIAERVASMTLTALGALGSLVVLVVIALFAAADPGLYRRGFLALLPAGRDRWDRTLSAAAHALRWWFLGQLVSMLVLGATVSLGLMALGIELWLSLGALTALLTFVPFLGPLVAGVPILIVAFAEGTGTGLAVLVFYLVVQNLEGNVLVPLIQHRAVDLAPALLISMQVLLGALFGLAGFVLAAPLTVVGMVMVRELHVARLAGGSGDARPRRPDERPR